MLKVILALGGSLLMVTGAQSATTHPEKKLTKAQEIATLLTKAANAKSIEQKRFYYLAASKRNSGLAYLNLADLNSAKDPKLAVNQYLMAARFGYERAYSKIGLLFKHGNKALKANAFLGECYINMGRGMPDTDLMHVCQSRFPIAFKIKPNLGLQSEYEVNLATKALLKNMCSGARAMIFAGTIDKKVRARLTETFCRSKFKQETQGLGLKTGDLLLQDNKVFKVTAEGIKPFQARLKNGDVVFKKNMPLSLYLFKDGKLIPAKNGDQVIKDGQAFVIKNNQLNSY